MKKNFDESSMEILQPRRFRVYKKLLDSFIRNRQNTGIDFTDPRFLNPDGTLNNGAVKAYSEELAEKELAEHAYVLSEFMTQADTKYEMVVGIRTASRKFISKSDFVYSPPNIQIKVRARLGENEFEANATDMIYDGYRILVKNGKIVDEITQDISYGVINYALRKVIGQPESIVIQLYRHGKYEEELVQEATVTFVEIPYVETVDDEENLRIEFKGVDDSFIAYGETKAIECRVKDGWKDVTDEVKSWSIKRTTESVVEDTAWGLKDKARKFNGKIDIVFSQFENDLGDGVKAEFKVTAILKSKQEVTAYLDI